MKSMDLKLYTLIWNTKLNPKYRYNSFPNEDKMKEWIKKQNIQVVKIYCGTEEIKSGEVM